MRAGESDWVALSNRLLLLQEIMVGLSAYPPDGVIGRAAEGVAWIFDGGVLRQYRPGELSPTPPVTRGRGRVGDLGEVYLSYFEGPPEPLYLVLSGADLADPQEFRLAALFFEHLLAALSASGYRDELARQARTDWLTGLSNRRSLEYRLARPPDALEAVGVLEVRPPNARTQAEQDVFLKELAERVRRSLPPGGSAFRVGAFRVALLAREGEAAALEAALAEYGATFGWARQGELGAAALTELFGAAETRLEARLLVPSAPGASQGLGDALGVTVESGLEQVRLAVTERLRTLNVALPPNLTPSVVFDTPTGFALETLSGFPDERRAGTLVVTDSTSQPYLHDLLAQKPRGLIVGSPNDAALAAALGRLGREAFYEGPFLEDDDLYPREREVWRLVARGLSNAQIAETLHIREKTVANYVTNLQDKLFLENRVELVLSYLGKLERS